MRASLAYWVLEVLEFQQVFQMQVLLVDHPLQACRRGRSGEGISYKLWGDSERELGDRLQNMLGIPAGQIQDM